jgi:Protein of unknown function (DUF4239)
LIRSTTSFSIRATDSSSPNRDQADDVHLRIGMVRRESKRYVQKINPRLPARECIEFAPGLLCQARRIAGDERAFRLSKEGSRMTLYWIYDLPNWMLGAVIAATLVGRLVGYSSKHNDVVSYFFGSMGVFYGLAMGLIAVATWENYTEIDGVVSTEAAAVASFYRDLDGYPQPLRGQLEATMREYTQTVIESEWPAHKKGVALETGDAVLDRLENVLMGFEPTKEREKISHAEVLRSWNTLIDQRRLRLQAVSTGLPTALWAVVLIGALLNGLLTYLFWVENIGLHACLVAILAVFIALLVFLTAAMDNPFRGEFSVSSDAFQTILEKVMTPGESTTHGN